MNHEPNFHEYGVLALLERFRRQIAAQDRVIVNLSNLLAAMLLRISTAGAEGRQIADEIQKDAREWNKQAVPFFPPEDEERWTAWLSVAKTQALGQNVTPS